MVVEGDFPMSRAVLAALIGAIACALIACAPPVEPPQDDSSRSVEERLEALELEVAALKAATPVDTHTDTVPADDIYDPTTEDADSNDENEDYGHTPGQVRRTAQDIASMLGAPDRWTWIAAWAEAENTNARWNILATTYHWHGVAEGATQFNSAGVLNYASEHQGVLATVYTLTHGATAEHGYDAIVEALRSGTYDEFRQAILDSAWCGCDDYAVPDAPVDDDYGANAVK